MTLPPATDITGNLNEYRMLSEKNLFDTTTLTLQQTYFGLPVWNAGVSVHIKNNSSAVLSSQTTNHTGIEVTRPNEDAVKRAMAVSEQELSRALGLNSIVNDGVATPEPRIESKRLVIYQYRADQRTSQPSQTPEHPNGPGLNGDATNRTDSFSTNSPTLPMPPPAANLQDRQHYVAVAVYSELPIGPYPHLHWVALLDVQSLSMLYVRAYVDHVNGLVFQSDPVTTNGGPLPSAASASLNMARISVPLSNLGSFVNTICERVLFDFYRTGNVAEQMDESAEEVIDQWSSPVHVLAPTVQNVTSLPPESPCGCRLDTRVAQ
jgi:hypothetical protein